MIDPFFQARDSFNRTGAVSRYMQDIAQTYGNPFNAGKPLPQRDSAAFERALQYRQRELQRTEDTERDLSLERVKNASIGDDMRTLLQKLESLESRVSQLTTATNVGSGAGGDDGRRDDGAGSGVVPAVQADSEHGKKQVTFSADDTKATDVAVPAGGGSGSDDAGEGAQTDAGEAEEAK